MKLIDSLQAFNRASNLHTHMRTHTNYKPFTCPYCGKGFHQKIDMKIHSYTHTGENTYRNQQKMSQGLKIQVSLQKAGIFRIEIYPNTHFALFVCWRFCVCRYYSSCTFFEAVYFVLSQIPLSFCRNLLC